jgi:ABC-type branched-subunit amino acid transport system substrate-binding protein
MGFVAIALTIMAAVTKGRSAWIKGDYTMVTRRKAALAGIAVVATVMAGAPALGADKVVKIGMDLSLTGADSEGAIRIRNGIMMAIDAVNEGNGIPGYKIEPMLLDDGTATAGQYDPAQAATNARPGCGRRARTRDERGWQGNGTDPFDGRARDHHPNLNQS